MAIEHGCEVDPGNKDIVAHVIRTLSCGSSQVGGHSNARSTGHVAVGPLASKWVRGGLCIQVGTVIPDGAGKIAAHRIDENLVLVEFEHNVWKPPEPLALHAVPI